MGQILRYTARQLVSDHLTTDIYLCKHLKGHSLIIVINSEESKMIKMTGVCLCGQVRYTASGEPTLVGVCHCTHCQKQTGSAFSIVVEVPKSAFSIQGRLGKFNDTGDSGHRVERNFCPDCGSPIFSDAAIRPEATFIKGGTLDDTSWLDPKIHIYCDSKERWTPIPDGSQKFGKMPG
jgi:hypothetical protein